MQRQDEVLLLITGNYKRSVMTHYERAFTFCHYFGLSRCPLVAAPGAVLEAPGWDQQLWEALPSLFLRQHPQPKEAAAGRARVPAGTEHPSEPGALHPSLTLWAQLNKGSSNSWLCWCSTTLLRKLIAGLKQGSSTHCRADQMIPTWKRWAVHMWIVIHRMAWFVLNCFSRDDWLV